MKCVISAPLLLVHCVSVSAILFLTDPWFLFTLSQDVANFYCLRLHYGHVWRIPNFNCEKINLIFAVCVTFRSHFLETETNIKQAAGFEPELGLELGNEPGLEPALQ